MEIPDKTLGNINKLILNKQKTKDKRQKFTKAFVEVSSNRSLSRQDIIKCDLVLNDFNDLIDPRFKNWVCKCYYLLGEETVRVIASSVRQSKADKPKNLFGKLLKVALEEKS